MTYADDREAEEAGRLLGSTVLRDVFDAIEADTLAKALLCEAGDDIGRYRLMETIRVLRDVRDRLNTTVGVHGMNKHFNTEKD